MSAEHDPRFDWAMRLVTTAVLVTLLILPVNALWGVGSWGDAGKIALTIVVGWLILAMAAAMIWNRKV